LNLASGADWLRIKKGCKGCEIEKNVPPDYILELNDLSVVDYCLNPVVQGHLVIQPRRHVEILTDLREDEMADIIRLARKYSNALLLAIDPKPEKIYFCTFSEDPEWHLHFHLIPRDRKIPQKQRGNNIFLRKVPTGERRAKTVQLIIERIKTATNQR
jgi:histidine triad (HIT) family protein